MVPKRAHGVDVDEDLRRKVNIVVFGFRVIILVNGPNGEDEQWRFREQHTLNHKNNAIRPLVIRKVMQLVQ